MRIVRGSRRGVPVVRLVGDVGQAEAGLVQNALSAAFRSSGGRVLLDLRPTAHLHYRVAGLLVAAARRRSVGIVGPTPYVRQILTLAGAVEGAVREYDDMGEALRDAVA